ncbi:MAG: hypothetical protein H0U12_12835 [Thermoleophilaceae bacterium]|jgi:hypothetical protein|nr:hypothetical protein [Thermoleophilaceae bacterium]
MLSTAIADDQTQQLQALRQANRVRLARAELKRRIAAGTVSASTVVLDCPWEAASMEIGDLLRSQRRWGGARCRRLLVSVGLSENKQLGTLTDRQREVLAAVLEAGAVGASGTAAAGDGEPAGRPRRRELSPV